MKCFGILFLLTIAVFISACSISYDIVVINDSDQPIELLYKLNERGQFDNPYTKSIEDRNIQKSIGRFWTKEKSWQQLPETDYATDSEKHERTIKIAPHQVIRIESGNYNPISEEHGDLTDIIEFHIKSANGEITYHGKLLLDQFEKNGYTFVKTYKDTIKERDSK